MGTLNEPAPNDVLGRVLPDEPIFTLAARDPVAAGVVRLYGALRARRLFAVKDIVANLIVVASQMPYRARDGEHAREASDCANKMSLWLTEHESKFRAANERAALDVLNQEGTKP